jgi:hypothetical protein
VREVAVKSARSVAIADHLWDLFGRMAGEMGSDREALVNQAMHVYARLNGYLTPGAPAVVPPPEAGGPPEPAEPPAALPPPIPSAPQQGLRELVLVRDDGAEVAVGKERFVIGRGRHCDLVVDSAKVSREHAMIVRDESGWLVEDLQSANGTWHRGARIERHRIEDGDELFVCSERIRCLLR